VIGAEVSSANHSLISTIAIEKEWNHLISELTPNQIKLVVKAKKKSFYFLLIISSWTYDNGQFSKIIDTSKSNMVKQ
jgi:hypothetical protein